MLLPIHYYFTNDLQSYVHVTIAVLQALAIVWCMPLSKNMTMVMVIKSEKWGELIGIRMVYQLSTSDVMTLTHAGSTTAEVENRGS